MQTTDTEYREVPGTELRIFPMGLGGNVFGGRIDAAESRAVLDAFVTDGGNFIDTADSYSSWLAGNSGGESETVLGDWMQERGNRDQVVLATKVSKHPRRPGLAPDNVRAALEDSLTRLRTDYVDLYYAHYDDPDRPIQEIADSFDAQVRAGRVRHVAISNFEPARIQAWVEHARAEGLAVPVALQPEYNLVRRAAYERDIAPLARRFSLATFPYYGVAGGFLTGKYHTPADLEGAHRARSVEKYMTEQGLAVVAELEAVARDHDAAPASVALAWLLSRPTVTAPLASATDTRQLEELMAAPRLQLADAELDRLDRVSRP